MLEPAGQEFTQPAVTAELVAAHGLTAEEYQKIVKALGREPNFTELGVFSVMWSEHCSYKSSRSYLKNLPPEGRTVCQGPAGTAGALDIAGGLPWPSKMRGQNNRPLSE